MGKWLYKGGHVVRVMFPNQEDKNQATYRWAIIIEDFVDEVKLVFMTKQLKQQSRYPRSFTITKKNNPVEYNQMGLKFDSLICPSRTHTVKKIRLYPPPQGMCPEDIIDKIFDVLNE